MIAQYCIQQSNRPINDLLNEYPISKFRNRYVTDPDALVIPDMKYPVIYKNEIYFTKNTRIFLESPVFYLKNNPVPGTVNVKPSSSVIAPLGTGKSTIASSLANSLGMVHIRLEDVLLEAFHNPWGDLLSERISNILLSGGSIPVGEDICAEAVIRRLRSADVLANGFVLDDFPTNVRQAEILQNSGIVPSVVIVIDKETAINRKNNFKNNYSHPPPSHIKNETNEQMAALQTFYSEKYRNVKRLNGSHSKWKMISQSRLDIEESVKRNQRYYRLQESGLPAPCTGLIWTTEYIIEKQHPIWKNYCPTSWKLLGRVVVCNFEYLCEYENYIYQFSSEKTLQQFQKSTIKILDTILPSILSDTVKQISLASVQEFYENFRDKRLTVNCYCPVTIDEDKLAVNLLEQKTPWIAEYMGSYYLLADSVKMKRFLLNPKRYENIYPNIKLAITDSLSVKITDDRPSTADFEMTNSLTTSINNLLKSNPLGYLQDLVGDIIGQSLIISGKKRLVYPRRGVTWSVLSLIGHLLMVKKKHESPWVAKYHQKKLLQFISDCEVHECLKLELSDGPAELSDEYVDQLRHQFDSLFKI
eukprot:GHVL01043905.1.p1 GENE.GHVL01043905.1~~GHVL01043905.1.p1  ORF type:complete len:618 (+),score=178.85 GHVL01043905.1:95-1855(+)